jgi:hypothetical protein
MQLEISGFHRGVVEALTLLGCFLVVKGPAADVTDAPQPLGLLCNPVMKTTSVVFVFSCNGAPVE